MSLNCTALLDQAVYPTSITSYLIEEDVMTAPDITSYLLGKNATVLAYLDEDITSFVNFNHLNNLTFYALFSTIAVSLLSCSYYISYIHFPRHMESQKKIQLRVLHSRGLIDRQCVISLLDEHTDGQDSVSQLIVDYIGGRVVESIESYLLRKSPHSLYLFLTLLCAGTLLYACFIPVYMMATHWNNSYVQYLKTECANTGYIYGSSRSGQFHINIESLCSASTAVEPGRFAFETDDEVTESSAAGRGGAHVHCFVNKNTFKVRLPQSDCCCSGERCGGDARVRCGKCGSCCHQCVFYNCANCCGFIGCFCCAPCFAVGCLVMCHGKMRQIGKATYTIKEQEVELAIRIATNLTSKNT